MDAAENENDKEESDKCRISTSFATRSTLGRTNWRVSFDDMLGKTAPEVRAGGVGAAARLGLLAPHESAFGEARSLIANMTMLVKMHAEQTN